MSQANVGLIGLAVMGQNLVLNMERNGYTVAVYNRTTSTMQNFVAQHPGKKLIPCVTLEELVASLERPRKVLIMVKAGAGVDAVISGLAPLLDEGDLIMDGGNSYYRDTERRSVELAAQNLNFMGVGISGGEEGALWGPSIMPGGPRETWRSVQDMLGAIAAKAPEDGKPCVAYLGPRGAGHYVKMVHNGIEYGDMQLIAESYGLMKQVLGMSNAEMQAVFAEWNQGKLDSYLIEITGDILGYKDEDGNEVIDLILDSAGQKGTGRWTAISALEFGIPLNLIIEAVLARSLSALKEERVAAEKVLSGPETSFDGDKVAFVKDIHDALYASKIISYTQGYMLMQEAAKQYGWNLNYGGIALMWRGGCIIRSIFLANIKEAFDKDPTLSNLLFDDYFKQEVENAQASWRRVVAKAVEFGIPVPAMSAALAFFDGFRTGRLPANMIQAQRDYFGAHTYQRVDRPRGEFFHTNWTGEGGSTTASTYTA